MIENKSEVVDILLLAKKYFIKMKREGKKVIVTFAGNNDFTVIKYLFNKYGIYFDFEKEFKSIDIQKEYEVYREGDVISGSNLAKTFHKVLKDKEYIQRMPKEKIETILQYNEQDVVNLYKIFINWKNYIKTEEDTKENDDFDEIKEIKTEQIINDIKEIDNEKNIEDVKKEQENNANDNIIIIEDNGQQEENKEIDNSETII